MIHDFQEICTTYLVSAPRKSLDLEDVSLRLSHCLQRTSGLDNGKSRTMDPFFLGRILLADHIGVIKSRSVPLIGSIVEATNDTFQYTEKPAELKARTLDMFHRGSSLRNLEHSVDNMDSLLESMTVNSSRLYALLGPMGPTSLSRAAADDMENLRGVVRTIKENISYAEKVKDGIMSLVKAKSTRCNTILC